MTLAHAALEKCTEKSQDKTTFYFYFTKKKNVTSTKNHFCKLRCREMLKIMGSNKESQHSYPIHDENSIKKCISASKVQNLNTF